MKMMAIKLCLIYHHFNCLEENVHRTVLSIMTETNSKAVINLLREFRVKNKHSFLGG